MSTAPISSAGSTTNSNSSSAEMPVTLGAQWVNTDTNTTWTMVGASTNQDGSISFDWQVTTQGSGLPLGTKARGSDATQPHFSDQITVPEGSASTAPVAAPSPQDGLTAESVGASPTSAPSASSQGSASTKPSTASAEPSGPLSIHNVPLLNHLAQTNAIVPDPITGAQWQLSFTDGAASSASGSTSMTWTLVDPGNTGLPIPTTYTFNVNEPATSATSNGGNGAPVAAESASAQAPAATTTSGQPTSAASGAGRELTINSVGSLSDLAQLNDTVTEPSTGAKWKLTNVDGDGLGASGATNYTWTLIAQGSTTLPVGSTTVTHDRFSPPKSEQSGQPSAAPAVSSAVMSSNSGAPSSSGSSPATPVNSGRDLTVNSIGLLSDLAQLNDTVTDPATGSKWKLTTADDSGLGASGATTYTWTLTDPGSTSLPIGSTAFTHDKLSAPSPADANASNSSNARSLAA